MKYRASIIMLALALALAGAVLADSTQPTKILTGKVVSTTPTQLILADNNGVQTTFVVDASAVPPNIMVGDQVSVSYQSQEGGSFRATNVAFELVADKNAAAESEPAPLAPAASSSQLPVPAVGDDELPRTASELPLIGLLALLSLGGAFGLRLLSRV